MARYRAAGYHDGRVNFGPFYNKGRAAVLRKAAPRFTRKRADPVSCFLAGFGPPPLIKPRPLHIAWLRKGDKASGNCNTWPIPIGGKFWKRTEAGN